MSTIRVEDKDGMYHYAFCDGNNELVCLVCSEHIVPLGNILDLITVAVPDAPAQLYHKSEWNLSEWQTWYAFGLAPAIEIYNASEVYGIADEIRTQWEYRRMQPC